MTYTPEQLLTIIGAVGVLVAAFGAVIVNIIVALRTGQKTDRLIVDTAKVDAKVEQVHVLANSNLSAVTSQLTNAVTKIEALNQMVDDLRSERQVAQTAAAFNTPVAGAGSGSGNGGHATVIAPTPNPEPHAC